ncbi:hypothetical protein DICPUDRAFT_158864 [Dictyostelium purpureum]|uniref:AN1-type domain-containing protein n=1 Tax=Dictyostelium purpureum TaxID=5786 RepID=F1A2P4_DICPU|nr:uncharacterized protein DICPUDRAFT_158864 [Dictyostelium purpureum]EGC29532.1 hypothetical protein DICPUDRAFT_158864 [Dictyostelium purpureum]|eukprot:XP_003293940.1 hypothetical protein DICPUDRAFT_158864 [Dictyostelium purpureum]
MDNVEKEKYQLDHVGVHCSVSDCRLLDFLPYKCECGKQYCHDHRDPEAHDCIKKNEKINKIVHPCPICNCLVKVDSVASIDQVISRHIDSGECGKTKPNVPKSYACTFKSCKSTEFVKVLCDKCKVNYCLKHRFPSSHMCPGKPINNTSTKTAKASFTTTSTTSSYKNISDSQYHTEQKKQKNDLTSLREEQKQRYISDTLRNVKDFININRTDGTIPYAICKDSSGQTPFSISQLDLTLQQLNLLPISTLYMVPLDNRSGGAGGNNNNNNNTNQEGLLSFLNPFKFFK